MRRSNRKLKHVQVRFYSGAAAIWMKAFLHQRHRIISIASAFTNDKNATLDYDIVFEPNPAIHKTWVQELAEMESLYESSLLRVFDRFQGSPYHEPVNINLDYSRPFIETWYKYRDYVNETENQPFG